MCLHVCMQIRKVKVKSRKGDIVNRESKQYPCLSQQIIKHDKLDSGFCIMLPSVFSGQKIRSRILQYKNNLLILFFGLHSVTNCKEYQSINQSINRSNLLYRMVQWFINWKWNFGRGVVCLFIFCKTRTIFSPEMSQIYKEYTGKWKADLNLYEAGTEFETQQSILCY